jgi:CHAT domain-containing protein
MKISINLFYLFIFLFSSCNQDDGLEKETYSSRIWTAMDSSEVLADSNHYEQALQILQTCAQQLPYAIQRDTPADYLYHKLGLQAYMLSDECEDFKSKQSYSELSRRYYDTAYEIRGRILKNHWLTHKTALNMAKNAAHNQSNYVLSQEYCVKALFDSHTDTTGISKKDRFLQADIAYNWGVALERLGDYDLAKAHALRADSIFTALQVLKESDNSNDFQNYLNNLSNLGDIYAAQKSHRALEYFNQVLQFGAKRDIPADIRLQVVLNRGIASRLMQQSKDAETDLLQAQKLCTERDDSANVRIELAKLYLDKNQYPLAENYAQESLELRSDYPNGHPVFAEIYTVLGQIYLKINQLKAKKYFEQAVGESTGAVLETWNVSKTYSHWQIEALKQLADLQTDTQKASDHYEKLCQRLHQRRVFLKTGAAKLNLTQQARYIFGKSISLNHQLYEKTRKTLYLNRMLNDMEQSKAVLMSEQIHHSYATQYAGIPNSIRQKERSLRFAIAQSEGILMKNVKNSKEYQHNLSKQYQSWQQFTADLEQTYPKYFQFKHAPPPQYTVEQIQKNLPEATGLINYYLNIDTLYILAVDKTVFKSYQIPLNAANAPFDFDTAYHRYQTLLPLDSWSNTYHNDFSEAAYFLYQQLLERPLRDFSPKTQILSLLPDDKLVNFNFSSLLTQKTKDIESPKPYLFKKYAAQWAYHLADAGILNPSKPKTARYKYVGFTDPFRNVTKHVATTKGFESLEYAVPHIQKVVQLWGNKRDIYADTMMNLAAFQEIAPKSNVIELVSHGSYDAANHNAAIVFPKGDSIESLDFNSLYNWDLSANEFIALVACETGKGYILKGETIISMAYAFGYAGSRRRLSAFWSIPHRNSMELMDIFFEKLAETQNTATALQRAQQLFLQNKTADKSIPYYWAGLVPSGSIQPIRYQ